MKTVRCFIEGYNAVGMTCAAAGFSSSTARDNKLLLVILS